MNMFAACPGGTKVYGTSGMFATGQSKTLFTEQVEMRLLGGNRCLGHGSNQCLGQR